MLSWSPVALSGRIFVESRWWLNYIAKNFPLIFEIECIQTNYAFLYSCILYLESTPTFSPRLATPNLQELKVLPSPLAYGCLPSCFCAPKPQNAGWRSAPGQSGWGPVAEAGTRHALGDHFGLPGPAWPSRGTQSLCSLSQSCCCSGPSASRASHQCLACSGSGVGPAAALSRGQ